MQYSSRRTYGMNWTTIYLLVIQYTISSVSAIPVRTNGTEPQSARQDVLTTEINHLSQDINTTTTTTTTAAAADVTASDINTDMTTKTYDVGMKRTTEGFDDIKSVTGDTSRTIAQKQFTTGYRTSLDTGRVLITTDADDSGTSTKLSTATDVDETTKTPLLDLYAQLSTPNPFEKNANDNEQLYHTLSDTTQDAAHVTDVIIPAYGQDKDNEEHILGGGGVDNRNHTNTIDENTPEVVYSKSRVSRSLRYLLSSTRRPIEETVTEVTDRSNTVPPDSQSMTSSLPDLLLSSSTTVFPTSLSPRVISPKTPSPLVSMTHVPTTSTIGSIDWRLLNRTRDDSDSLAWITSSVFSRLLNLREDDIKVQVYLNIYARLSDHPKVPESLIEDLRTCQNISVVYSALSTLKDIFYSYGPFADMLIGGNDLRMTRAKYCGLRKSIRRLTEPSSTGSCSGRSPDDVLQDSIRTVETLATLNLLAVRTSNVIQEIIQMHGQCPGV